MSRAAQNILYALIIIVVAVLLYQWSPQEHEKITVQGMFLHTNQSHYPAVPVDQVKVYRIMPAHAMTIGIIHTHEHYSNLKDHTIEQLEKSALNYSIRSAAQHGATGLVVSPFTYSSKVPNQLDFVQLRSWAVIVKQ